MLTPRLREVRIRADLIEGGCEGSGVSLAEARFHLWARKWKMCKSKLK